MKCKRENWPLVAAAAFALLLSALVVGEAHAQTCAIPHDHRLNTATFQSYADYRTGECLGPGSGTCCASYNADNDKDPRNGGYGADNAKCAAGTVEFRNSVLARSNYQRAIKSLARSRFGIDSVPAFSNLNAGHDNADVRACPWRINWDTGFFSVSRPEPEPVTSTVGTFVAPKPVTPTPPPPPSDGDKDGVPDSADICPSTPAGDPVSSAGCSTLDSDSDGMDNERDHCANTPAGTTVNGLGCPVRTTPAYVQPLGPYRYLRPVTELSADTNIDADGELGFRKQNNNLIEQWSVMLADTNRITINRFGAEGRDVFDADENGTLSDEDCESFIGHALIIRFRHEYEPTNPRVTVQVEHARRVGLTDNTCSFTVADDMPAHDEYAGTGFPATDSQGVEISFRSGQ